ncbi:hypothetical protein T484DRAFT_1887075, partial [Baffinella frigidus]
MRRAALPLEKLLHEGGDRFVSDALRHAVMDLRDALENAHQALRRTHRDRTPRLLTCLFPARARRNLDALESEVARCTEELEQLLRPADAHSAPPEPPLLSRRLLRGDRSEMRCVLMASDRRLWCGSRQLRLFDADSRRLVQTVAGAFGMVRAALEVGVDASGVPASSMRGLQGKEVWTGHSDGRVRVWSAGSVAIQREMRVEARVPVLCLAQVGAHVWAGTASGAIFLLDPGGTGPPRALDQVARVNQVARGTRGAGGGGRHEGAVRCILQVGGEVWTGSSSGEIYIWGCAAEPPGDAGGGGGTG